MAHRAPLAVVCLISALTLHELTDEVPAVVQIAVPRGTYRPRIAYPPTEVSEFDPCTFDLGVQEREVAPGERVRIYGPARSVVDVMRLRHRVGEPVALRALRHWVQRPDADLAELLDYARAPGRGGSGAPSRRGGAELMRSALERTSTYRGIALRPLSRIVVRLPQLRQSSYTAWRRRQMAEVLAYPGDFAEVVRHVIGFADPLISDQVGDQHWRAVDRVWSAADPAK